jgi:signal transduction histidine kinase
VGRATDLLASTTRREDIGAVIRVLIPAGLLTGIFILDISRPGDVVFSLLYMLPIISTRWIGRPGAAYLTFVVASVATVAGAAFAPPPAQAAAAFANRALGLLAQTMAATVVMQGIDQNPRADATAQDQQGDAILTMVAHELRAPLSTLRGYTQMAQAGAEAAGAAAIATTLHKALCQADRLNTMISELLDLARLQHGQVELRLTPVDLETLLQEVIERRRAADPTRPTAISLSAGGIPRIEADAQRLEQVFSNLLDNAAKYSPQGSTVEIRVYPMHGGVAVAVTDHGIGIPEEEQATLFQRFRRGPHGTHHASGLGVGLYISHQLVLRHGGRLAVQSIVGEGSTFTCTLPLHPPATCCGHAR